MPGSFAYLFERFPTFTQTFCYREVREMERQQMPPELFSIRMPTDEPPQDFPGDYRDRIHYLPEETQLVREMKQLHSERRLPRAMRRLLMDWPGTRDKHRVYEAAWVGPRLRKMGIRHVHVHFAGLAARTAYWMKKFHGIGYSFTGHANDIFCCTDLPVSLEQLIREAAFVATVSEYSARELKKNNPAFAGKIHRVYNGIDINHWSPTHHTPDPAAPVLVSVGRYIEKKGFGDLIEACRLLHVRGRRVQCKIIGEGPMESQLQRQIAEGGLKGIVELTGPRSQNEILDSLHHAQAFVLPCVVERDGGKDNLPTVIMEAMACALPVVSTPLAGVPELVLQDETGLLVPEHEPAALADAIERLLADASLRERLGRAGRRRAETAFAIEVTTRQLKHLLVRQGNIRPPFAAAQADGRLWPAALLRAIRL